MLIGIRKCPPDSPLVERSNQSIQFALSQIQSSGIAPYVSRVILYGSCARREQQYKSDVDLFMEVSSDAPEHVLHDEILWLKGHVSPPDSSLPEVDLKVAIGAEWQKSNSLYYKNVNREGKELWKTSGT